MLDESPSLKLNHDDDLKREMPEYGHEGHNYRKYINRKLTSNSKDHCSSAHLSRSFKASEENALEMINCSFDKQSYLDNESRHRSSFSLLRSSSKCQDISASNHIPQPFSFGIKEIKFMGLKSKVSDNVQMKSGKELKIKFQDKNAKQSADFRGMPIISKQTKQTTGLMNKNNSKTEIRPNIPNSAKISKIAQPFKKESSLLSNKKFTSSSSNLSIQKSSGKADSHIIKKTSLSPPSTSRAASKQAYSKSTIKPKASISSTQSRNSSLLKIEHSVIQRDATKPRVKMTYISNHFAGTISVHYRRKLLK